MADACHHGIDPEVAACDPCAGTIRAFWAAQAWQNITEEVTGFDGLPSVPRLLEAHGQVLEVATRGVFDHAKHILPRSFWVRLPDAEGPREWMVSQDDLLAGTGDARAINGLRYDALQDLRHQKAVVERRLARAGAAAEADARIGPHRGLEA